MKEKYKAMIVALFLGLGRSETEHRLIPSFKLSLVLRSKEYVVIIGWTLMRVLVYH